MISFTTYKIAKMCSVYPSTVINWINEGKLKAFLTAGGHHRVTRAELVNFLTQLKIPLPPELAQEKKVLIVDDEPDTCVAIERSLLKQHQGILATQICHTGIEALIRIGEWRPHLVVLDIVLPKMDGCQVCRILKSKPETQTIKIIGISGDSNFNARVLRDYRIDAFFPKPLDLDALAAKSLKLLGLEHSNSQQTAG